MAPWWLRSGSDDSAQDDDPAAVSPAAPENPSKPEEASESEAIKAVAQTAEAAAEAGEPDQETKTGPKSASRRRRRRRRRSKAATAAEAKPGNEPKRSDESAVEPVAAKQPVARQPDAKISDEPASSRAKSEATSRDSAAKDVAEKDVPKKDAPKKDVPGKDSTETAPAAAPESTDPPATEPQRVASVEDREEDLTDDDSESELSLEALSSKGHLVYAVPDRGQSMVDERKIAMFVDFENIALGVRASEIKALDVNLILERLLEKGKIIVKKAYADWERYSEFKRPFHEAAMELIDIPQKYYSGKNSADIKMVVDAMDLCYSKEHLDTFVLVSGDSDFSPLVSKLKENNKYVIGLGVKNSSSNLLVDNCDEFLYYEDVWRDSQRAPKVDHLPAKQAECFKLMSDAMLALFRENKDVLWGSMLKQTMKRKRPSFNEGYYGYGTFSELLEDAASKNLIRLRRDRRSGSYIVAGFVLSQKR